jgi:hypothetical protein
MDALAGKSELEEFLSIPPDEVEGSEDSKEPENLHEHLQPTPDDLVQLTRLRDDFMGNRTSLQERAEAVIKAAAFIDGNDGSTSSLPSVVQGWQLNLPCWVHAH